MRTQDTDVLVIGFILEIYFKVSRLSVLFELIHIW